MDSDLERHLHYLEDDAAFVCDECGRDFYIDGAGCSHHYNAEDGCTDYDLDADHVPYSTQNSL